MNVQELVCLVVYTLAGGLIGFGICGTVQAACLGAGIGLLTFPILYVLANL